MIVFLTVMSKSKRQRKQTNRFGESSTNMDEMFDDIDERTSNSPKDDDFVPSDEQQSNVSHSGAPEAVPLKENDSQSVQQKQLARLEAKLNAMQSTLMQIHRACISNVVSTQMESENIQELPLTSDTSLNKFEQDLTQKSYRQKIVSDFLN